MLPDYIKAIDFFKRIIKMDAYKNENLISLKFIKDWSYQFN
ncbi:hypothetical protein [Klebsiella pneumoniae IS39]|nr:hypothetical protein [Klebsiella pneumoniae IS39]